MSVLYGNIMVQTEVIDDSCSPMWMPWSSRAFVFELNHPSTAIYVGVADYDLGPLEHECIGRAAIDMEKLFPNTMYTLTYRLCESNNLIERGDEDLGTITVRLRIEVDDERRFLAAGRTAPQRQWVNSQQWKSHRVAKFCVDGPHDDDVFEMRLFRSHINELLSTRRYATWAVADAIKSLVFWRSQVKVGGVWLPVHSAVVWYLSIHVVENPRLIPSFVLFGCAWVMVANMLRKATDPNPWRRGRSMAHHFNVLTHGRHDARGGGGGGGGRKAGKTIAPNEGLKEYTKKEARWKQKVADWEAAVAKNAELTAKIKEVSDEAVIRTKGTTNSALVDPISAVAGAKLLPYQQWLGGYCQRVRYVRNVMNWNESIISFFITLKLLALAVAALFVPWGFILLWTSRLLVWGGLGPWMRIIDAFFHEETERQKTKASEKAKALFREEHRMAKMMREHALKVRLYLFYHSMSCAL